MTSSARQPRICWGSLRRNPSNTFQRHPCVLTQSAPVSRHRPRTRQVNRVSWEPSSCKISPCSCRSTGSPRGRRRDGECAAPRQRRRRPRRGRRHVGQHRRRTIRAVVSELTDVTIVALSLATEPERVAETVSTVQPQVVHLAAGSTAGLDLVARLRDELAPVELMVTIPVRGAESITTAQAFAPVSDYLLLDSTDPQSGTVGATGLTHDWSVSRQIVAASTRGSSWPAGSAQTTCSTRSTWSAPPASIPRPVPAPTPTAVARTACGSDSSSTGPRRWLTADAAPRRLQRLAEELGESGLRFEGTPAVHEMLVQEIDQALRPAVHEQRAASSGTILDPDPTRRPGRRGRSSTSLAVPSTSRSRTPAASPTGSRAGCSAAPTARTSGWCSTVPPAQSVTSSCWPACSTPRSCSATPRVGPGRRRVRRTRWQGFDLAPRAAGEHVGSTPSPQVRNTGIPQC